MSARTLNEYKKAAGTYRPDRALGDNVIAYPVLEEMPPMPNWLPNPDAVEEWNRLAPFLFSIGVMNKGSIHAFAHYCALHGTLVAGYRKSEMPNAAMINALRGLQTEFGLTPMSNAKMGMTKSDKPKPNKFTDGSKK
jgi:phage terminase small subunit